MELLLPGAATALCLVLAWRMLARFARRRRVHELIWGATFSAFGLAAGAETYANLLGWTPALVRLYYLAGASMSVGFLALGALVLLVPRPIALVALGVVLIQSLSMVFFVLRTPVDPELARTLGWEALPKEAPVRALALTINVLGTMVVLLGTFGSAYAQWSRGQGSRAFGVFLIGLGTLIVASGASLTRFGHHYLYGPMVLGLLVILAGYVRVTAPAAPRLVTESDRNAGPPAATPDGDDTIAAGQLGSSHGTFS
ncbi:MAG: hypothetical protein IT306_02710 [Chloroflexi bacterium]|nr:hypothetical protein [Chloroflexota bacterium]